MEGQSREPACPEARAGSAARAGLAITAPMSGTRVDQSPWGYAALVVWNNTWALRPPRASEDPSTIEAPCRTAISFAMARPNPLPVTVVSVNASDPNNSQRTPAMDPLFRDEPFDEAEPGAHRSHGVRAGRANANGKQIHHADLQYSLCIGMRALRF